MNVRTYFIALAGLCLLLSLQSFCRNYAFHPVADRLLSDSAYRTIIIDQIYQLRPNNRLSKIDCEANVDAGRESFLQLATPHITRKFNETAKRFGKTIPKDRIASQLFENALRNAVTVSIRQNKNLAENLYQKNENDRILSFHSRIHLQKNGQIRVSETIKIANYSSKDAKDNNSIRRGITRDFPTKYETPQGLVSSVPFELISITRNGKAEPHKEEKIDNGIRIFCGRSDYFLEEGMHEYVIEYQTAKQLKFHQDRDEFYWNVSGNGWDFTIDKVIADIDFPEGAHLTELNCYTGAQGENEKNCHYQKISGNHITFITDQRLQRKQGLTISVSVQKGIFNNTDTGLAQFIAFAKDNLLLVTIFPAVLILIMILFLYWWKVGRDPRKGVIIPSFTPPDNLSPAAAGYLFHEGYNDKIFSAALIDLAVQHKLKIQVDKEGLIFKNNVYTFLPPESIADELDRDTTEQAVYGFSADELFGTKIVQGKYDADFASIRNSFKKHIEKQIIGEEEQPTKSGLLKLNNTHIGLGFLFLFLTSVAAFIYALITRPPVKTLVYIAVALLIGFILQAFFTRIVKALTKEGRRLADLVLGFKMYLETAEKNELDLMNPPEENLQLFERYLPYAVALGVENRWSARFKAVIERSLAEGYQPSYYSFTGHSGFSGSANYFAADLSSGLSRSVASASTPPSSSGSSGSGGGGFSGGGGGGGGGGGW